MSLSVTGLYDLAKAQVGGGSGSQFFQDCFINAVNCALDEMSDAADLVSRHSHITQTNSSISTLSSSHWYMLYAGVIYYLIRMGQRPTDPKIASMVYQDSFRGWESAKANYITRILNDLQADTTADVVKFGYVGTATS
jgi:hypothetical protein